MNRLLAILLPFVFTSCGYTYLIRGHGTNDRSAPLTMRVGERKLVLVQKWIPVRFGYDLGMISADPSIVDAEYRKFPDKPIWLVAKAPSVTKVYYGNLLSRPHLKNASPARRAESLQTWGYGFRVTVEK